MHKDANIPCVTQVCHQYMQEKSQHHHCPDYEYEDDEAILDRCVAWACDWRRAHAPAAVNIAAVANGMRACSAC